MYILLRIQRIIRSSSNMPRKILLIYDTTVILFIEIVDLRGDCMYIETGGNETIMVDSR